ncbi:hypothetical protein A3C09_03045 [Candidatus Uhrbacteria bacterium RIFCSPHIGHO2_02_FULL_47_44]|uniref:M23ase beta-sheet core domain-containing protein n=1 Tax=Candidatus Uhrbacteria bacterium RIFCSPLOWO2_02_FULL_48_18 TaxID=1802408 RepID=A0A1F7V6T9_9BACT|nr:MAG: hypothetical protein A2839_01370 [Candidatus Uhrbacteria bacterium RIFCSPHIGHO2_01_FULL_47_10]OGL69725.1 MAG: hypothetical protein A3C09_03045 [Candidatus Uhrbacteria bacterium RIFCSPHIGHO2_02_FULL_47_44]OGL76904.1 MAG: hypothetical protein A3E97_04445 [Candidatus Uhrbacteria bacterium RIFCSPHIGHO2_12_FULL_47_12]OGL80334.1 MAG: hypothetical protein A3B20_02820 [Candidatus Uhrbacteria bacterium RIFCSPLOWO2_01_FULL_47_17]OGL86193.1 MAG: hypothetical protein A3I41_01310 [Candidatus Uhrbact
MSSLFDTVIRTFCWSMMVAIFAAMFISCASTDSFDVMSDASESKDVHEASGVSFDEGGTVPIIQMPFAAGHTSQCTQGVNGDTSHHSTSTMYDVDFDTSNTSKQELRAPVSGVVRVHVEDASKNFGYHVCIDLGNGTYVVIGHMSDISVRDGTSVVAGELLGHEGCTGYCSGDHVHIGLHVGDARKMAQFGVSIPVRYMLSDKTAKTKPSAVESASLVCGIKSLGDSVNGHFYISALPSVHAQVINASSTSSTPPPAKNPDPPPSKQPKESSEDVWVNDYGLDGTQETLMVKASRWTNSNLATKDAFVWGMGGCFDQKLTEADRVHAEYDYYQIDFSKLGKSCLGEFTLISSVGTDGKPPNVAMTNWNWWQNAPMCSQGSPFCQLKKNGQPWEEWMLRVVWDPDTGLMPFGNGYTKNAQLP